MSYYEIHVPWTARVANQWGHRGAQLLIVSILGAIMLGLRPLPPSNPLAFEAPVLLLVFVLASWYFMRQHDRRLCESCMSSLPLNASEAGVRYGRRLAVAHLASRLPLTFAYLVALMVSSPLLLSTDLLPSTLAHWLWAAIQSTMIYLVLAYSTHRRLQPWCPRCRGGDGGNDGVDTPDPVPTGSQVV